jgi:peptide chain release factor 1
VSLSVKLERLLHHHNDLREALATSTVSDPQEFAKLSKEYSDLTPVAEAIILLKDTEQEIANLEAFH